MRVGRRIADVSTTDDEPQTPKPGTYRRQVLKNTVATAFANGWTILLALVSIPLMLRGLGTAAFGTWALLQTFSAVTGWLSLADLGMGVATTRSVADASSVDDRRGVGRTAGSALGVALLIGLVAATALLVLGRAFMADAFQVPESLQDDLKLALVPFAIQVVFELLGSVAGSCLDGLQRIDRSRALDSFRRTLVIIASVSAALITENLAWVVLAAAMATVLATTVSGITLASHLQGASVRPDRSTARQLLHYGRRVWLLNGTGIIHRSVDRTVVGVILGPSAVALVEIATQVQNGAAAVMSASSYTATTSAAWVTARDDHGRLRELLLRGTKYTCLVTLPLCGLVAVLAGPLIEVWLPTGYASAAGLVVLAVIYLGTQAPLATGSNLLLGVGRAGDILGPAALAVAVNLFGSIVLVNRIGIAGAFVATIISSLVLTPLLARAVSRATDVSVGVIARSSILPALIPTALATAAAGLIVMLPVPALLSLVLGFTVGGAIWLTVAARWSLDGDERAELLRLMPRRS